MKLSLFDVIRTAYRSRLLFRSESGYRDLTGVGFETIRDHQGDEDAMLRYYDVLNRECDSRTDESLRMTVADYVVASEVCRGEVFDWMERRQLASRKKFCRLLFRKVSAPGCRMTADEEMKFGMRDCDKELEGDFFPDGPDGEWEIDLIFVMLITFGVIKPVTASRGRDLGKEELMRQLEAMSELVRCLRDDAPRSTVLQRSTVFDVALEDLRRTAEGVAEGMDADHMGVVWFRRLLRAILVGSRVDSSPGRSVEQGVATNGYSMPGIWVDDHDGGATRFWVFPENQLMAFCYREEQGAWRLVPYEFAFHSQEQGEIGDDCVFVSAEGNREVMNAAGGVMSGDHIVIATCEKTDFDEDGRFRKISFEPDLQPVPGWFGWRSFIRLPEDGELFARFRQVLRDIYDPKSPQSLLFENEGAFMTDARNAMVGMDYHFIYVWDCSEPYRASLQPYEEDGFIYDVAGNGGALPPGFPDLRISRESPLYLIPRSYDTDRPMPDLQRRFAEAAMHTTMSHPITLYSTDSDKGKALCFNMFGVTVPVEDAVAKFGVKRITSCDEFKFF